MPDETKRSFSMEGKQRVTSSARLASAAMEAPKLAPLAAACWMASTTVGKGVAEDHGAPGAEEIEVAVAVFVVEVCAFGVSEEGRVSAYGTEGADG